MNRLKEILEHKRREVDYLRGTCTQAYLESVSAIRRNRPPFVAALRAAGMALIAEVKQRSPSAGVIRTPFEPHGLASAYEDAGAQAISVLVDGKYFGGSIQHMAEIRDTTRLPILYKEFIVDEWQIWQASSLGASAALLIVAALKDAELRAFIGTCQKAGVESLVEVHNEKELKRATDAGAVCIGVNNRDLKTFEVSLETSFRLAGQAPASCTLISESGIHEAAQVRRLREAGYHGVLVGEHLLRQPDPAQAVADLMAETWGSS